MTILEAITLYRKLKPWLEKFRPLLSWLAGLFKSDPNAPKVYRPNDPDKPRDATEDLKSENQPNV